MKYLYDVPPRQRMIRQIVMWSICSALVVLAFIGGYFIGKGVINQPRTARTHMGAEIVNDLLYIVGGQDASTGNLLNDVWEIQPDSASLRLVAQLPYACHLPDITACQDSLYVLGGYDGESYRNEILRIRNGQVDMVAELPGSRAYGCTVGIDNNLIYAGGWDGQDYVDEIVSICLTSGESSVVAHLPSPRRFVAAARVGDLVYFIGGESTLSQFSDEIVEFDPSAGRITRIGHLPSGRYLVETVEQEDGLLVLGGRNTRSLDEIVTVDLSQATISSQTTDRLPGLSWNHSIVALNDKVFVVGGSNAEFSQAIGLAEYVPNADPPLIPIRLRKSPWR